MHAAIGTRDTPEEHPGKLEHAKVDESFMIIHINLWYSGPALREVEFVRTFLIAIVVDTGHEVSTTIIMKDGWDCYLVLWLYTRSAPMYTYVYKKRM